MCAYEFTGIEMDLHIYGNHDDWNNASLEHLKWLKLDNVCVLDLLKPVIRVHGMHSLVRVCVCVCVASFFCKLKKIACLVPY